VGHTRGPQNSIIGFWVGSTCSLSAEYRLTSALLRDIRGLRRCSMPVQKCKKDGKSGHKYGSSGKCYTGSDSKKKAAKQGRAIKARKNSR